MSIAPHDPGAGEPLAEWVHDAEQIGAEGKRIERHATDAERQALASALDLIACEAMTASYVVRPTGRRNYLVEGYVRARVTQACVISLEPVTSDLDEAIRVRLAPASEVESCADIDIEAEDPPEPLDDRGRIPVGRIIYEHIASGLDPYPRRPDAVLEVPTREARASASPFAALEALRNQRPGDENGGERA